MARLASLWAVAAASLGLGARQSRAVCKGAEVGGRRAPRFAASAEGAAGLLPGWGGLWPAEGGDCSGETGRLKQAAVAQDPVRGPASSCARSCVSAAAPGRTR